VTLPDFLDDDFVTVQPTDRPMSRKFLPEPNMEPRPGFVVHYSDETYLHYEDLCTWSFQRIIGGYPGVSRHER